MAPNRTLTPLFNADQVYVTAPSRHNCAASDWRASRPTLRPTAQAKVSPLYPTAT
jgi:hypothetical protein